MKAASSLILLLCSLGVASAQNARPTAPFAAAVDTLRGSMLKLSSIHKLTAANGTVYDYNISILDVTADATACTLTWKDKVDMVVSQQIHTKTVNLEDILTLNSVSSANSKMGVEPFVQIVQFHMKPSATAIDTLERFSPEGNRVGTPETKRVPIVTILSSSEAEATTLIQQLTAVMTKCTVQKLPPPATTAALFN